MQILSILLMIPLAFSNPPQLKPSAPLTLAGDPESFDFMASDPSLDRILAAHRGARTLEVINLSTGAVMNPTNVGAAQGLAVDTSAHVYYVGNEADKTVAAIDAKTMRKLWELRVDGPVDAIAFDPRNQRVYAAEDDGNQVWVIDTKAKQLIGVVKIPGVPEVLEYDAITDQIYLNIKDKDEIVRIDPTTNLISATWKTSPVVSPHGLVIDHARGKIYTAGGNGKLAEVDIHSGEVTSVADIAMNVDQIAYDESKRIVYGAGKGFISASQVTKSGLRSLPDTPSPAGAHTIAVDAKRHEVWVCFKGDKHSQFQKFSVYSAP